MRDFPPEAEQMPGGDKCICLLNISWIKGRFTYHNECNIAIINEHYISCSEKLPVVIRKRRCFPGRYAWLPRAFFAEREMGNSE
jgi:hypothetical protein